MGICFGKKKEKIDVQVKQPKIRFIKEFKVDHHFVPISEQQAIIPQTPSRTRYC